MHCLKTIHDICGDLQVILYNSNETSLINRDDWNELQKNSFVCNPFYEDWNLLPALHHLTHQNESIHIVTVYSRHKLIGLFPVAITKLYKIVPVCSIWQHDHAYLSEPLQSAPFDLARVLSEVCEQLGGVMSYMPQHQAIYQSSHVTVCFHQYQRAAILDHKHIQPHLNNLGGKRMRELKRVKRKLEEEHNIEFVRFADAHEGLNAYSELEHLGWKGSEKGSIYSHKNIKEYYLELIQTSESGTIEVLGLISNKNLIACAIRLNSNNHYFEIKTTYDERFKMYAPGKVLEWYLLQDLKSHNMERVDSCTHSDNHLINWLWPDRIDVYRSYIFSQQPIGRAMAKLHSVKQRIEKRYTHA